jgi:hypothetical protein
MSGRRTPAATSWSQAPAEGIAQIAGQMFTLEMSDGTSCISDVSKTGQAHLEPAGAALDGLGRAHFHPRRSMLR